MFFVFISALPSALNRGKCLCGRAIINLFINSTAVQILVGTVVLRTEKQGFVCFFLIIQYYVTFFNPNQRVS